jgi:murein DD-endopeptidase MepM/ murein hydrolase activator NlpD
MKKLFNILYQTQPSHFFGRLLVGVILVSMLVGCNLPQPLPTAYPRSSQRQTEVAGILNPDGSERFEETPVTRIIPDSLETLPEGYVTYITQPGDTLLGLAERFEVPPAEIKAFIALPYEGFLPVGTALQIPDAVEDVLPYVTPIFPDLEVIYGPTVGDFDAAAYSIAAGGFLSSYLEKVKEEWLTGPEIVQRVTVETSTNPRLLLAFLEYRSGWVLGNPVGAGNDQYPIGYNAGADTGLYKELMITAKLLAQGFYGWRDGSFENLVYFGGESGRLSPGLNAGSVALMHTFASISEKPGWEAHLYGETSFLFFYQEMFGDYWARAASINPDLLNPTEQPVLSLPFTPGQAWSLTGGPHVTWQTGTPRGAVDFAPITGEPACVASAWWATAAAPGLVVRSENSVVAIDLDGDGDEGTGWVLIYQHMAEKERVQVGTWLDQDAPVGHPSCEGGQASGTHLHFTRKWNGEWLGVSDPFPLVLSGYQAFAGEGRYEGYLQNGDLIVSSSPNGTSKSLIIRVD